MMGRNIQGSVLDSKDNVTCNIFGRPHSSVIKGSNGHPLLFRLGIIERSLILRIVLLGQRGKPSRRSLSNKLKGEQMDRAFAIKEWPM